MAWRCTKCGKIIYHHLYEGGLGECPSSRSGEHTWVKTVTPEERQAELLKKQNKLLEEQNRLLSGQTSSTIVHTEKKATDIILDEIHQKNQIEFAKDLGIVRDDIQSSWIRDSYLSDVGLCIKAIATEYSGCPERMKYFHDKNAPVERVLLDKEKGPLCAFDDKELKVLALYEKKMHDWKFSKERIERDFNGFLNLFKDSQLYRELNETQVAKNTLTNRKKIHKLFNQYYLSIYSPELYDMVEKFMLEADGRKAYDSLFSSRRRVIEKITSMKKKLLKINVN